MITPHVASGRRNLAANMVQVMRYVGMRAYQTPLFPNFPAARIKQLNHLNLAALKQENLNVRREVQRALAVSQALAPSTAGDIHFVANNLEAILNLRRWNREITTDAGRDWWDRRTITYFVYDPRSIFLLRLSFVPMCPLPELPPLCCPPTVRP